MDLKTQPLAYREAYGVFEAFRRLGFNPNEIFFCMNKHGQVWIELHSQGKEFIAHVGDMPGVEPDEIERGWNDLCLAIVDYTISDEDMETVWKESKAFKDSISLLASLKAKGFEFPYLEEKDPEHVQSLN